MLTFIHIGAVKCASKSLQQSLMVRHPEVFSLGLGVDGAGRIHWLNPDLARTLEIDIRFRQRLSWDPGRARAVLDRALSEARRASGKKAVGLSYENLSLTYSRENDLVEKAERLRACLPGECRIVYLIRDQLRLLRSLYAEQMLSGARLGFREYIDHLLKTSFNSCLHELCFDRVVRLYEGLFGAGSVWVFPLESLAAPGRDLLGELCAFLGLSDVGLEFPRAHASPSPRQLALLARFNAKARYQFGDQQFRFIHGWRLLEHNPDYPGWPHAADDLVDELMRRTLTRAALEHADAFPRAHLALDYTPAQQAALVATYGPGNRWLAERLGAAFGHLNYPGMP